MNGIQLPKLGPAAELARFFIMFALSQLLMQTGAFQQLLKSPKGGTDRFLVMNAHS